jgi:HlyD family secretion protein
VKKKWIAVGLVVVLAVVGIVIYRRQQAEAASKNAAQQYATATAKRQDLEVTVTGTANIVSNDKRTVKSQVPGTLVKILVDDGQPVKENQVIMQISNEDLVNQLHQASIDLETQKLKLSQMRAPTSGDRASALSRLATAQTALENRKKDLGKTIITSPIEGRVVRVSVNPGDAVAAGQLLATIGDDTEVLFMANVVQLDIGKVKVGMAASIGFGSELPVTDGVVEGISAEALVSGKNTVVPVAIRLSNQNRIYRPGLAGNATIKIKNDDAVSAGGVLAPQTKYEMRAEVTGNIDQVFVKDGDSAQKGDKIVTIKNDNVIIAIQAAESEVQQAKENLDRVSYGLAPGITENDIKQQELRIRTAEVALQTRQSDVESLQVKSPINGTLISHAPAAGDTIVANQAVYVVADYSKMTMVIQVDELDITHLLIGQKATVIADALPGKTFGAEVTKIATEGTIKDGVANYDVTLTLIDTKDLRGAMTGNATITIASKSGALVVPAEAIRTQGGKKRVMILKDGQPVQIDVRIGLSNDTLTEVVEGVKEGDVLVISSLTRNTQTQNRGMFGR